MKKVNLDAVSIALIKKINQTEIAKRTQAMSEAVTGAPLIFKGVLPYTAVAIALIVTTYLNAQAAYKLGGILKRSAFLTAKKALYNCVLAFAPYINSIALGDIEILKLSTLPLLSESIDYATLIAAGGTAQNIRVLQGNVARQIVTSCNSFGLKVGYTVIVSEGAPLPMGFNITTDGSVYTPVGTRCIVNSFGTRYKVFNNLLPKTEYFVYYVLSCGGVLGVISNGKSIITSA